MRRQRNRQRQYILSNLYMQEHEIDLSFTAAMFVQEDDESVPRDLVQDFLA